MNPYIRQFIFLILFFVVGNTAIAAVAAKTSLNGAILDPSGAAIPDAEITLFSLRQTMLEKTYSGLRGEFTLPPLPEGSYSVRIAANNFQTRTISVDLSNSITTPLKVTLNVAVNSTDITVTTKRGAVENISDSANFVSAWDRAQLYVKPGPDIRDVLQNMPGLMLQETTPGQVSPFLRGLTGYQTLILIDGIRFNTSTFRSGPNQYMGLIETNQIDRLETVLGPSGSTFGSDSLGGTIQVVTRQLYPTTKNPDSSFHGEGEINFNSADLGGGAAAQISRSGKRHYWLIGGSRRMHNDLRAGDGFDSRNVFRRYTGLSFQEVRNLLGDRLQDTAYSQAGFHSRLTLFLPKNQSLTAWYQHGSVGNERSYRELLGGRGRLQAKFEPQRLNFFYLRYEKLGMGLLESLSSTFSVNSQRDDSIRQSTKFTSSIENDRNRVDAFGWTVQATSHIKNRHVLAFGGELYREHIDSYRYVTDPVSEITSQERALYPNGSRYTTFSIFGEQTSQIVKEKLRINLGGRLTTVFANTFADRNITGEGESLGVIDSGRTFHDLTFHTGVSWNITPDFVLSAIVRRGFRAPNMNDIGAVGYSGTGYEIPASSAAEYGALRSGSSSDDALPSGGLIEDLKSETLYSYELGLRYGGRETYGRIHFFDSEMYDPIVRRTLLFPSDNIPAMLEGIPVEVIPPTPEQEEAGVVTVAPLSDYRAVKAFVNEGRSRYYGIEATGRIGIGMKWSVGGSYDYIIGRELNPNRPARRLPPQQLLLSIRYAGGGRMPWMELQAVATGKQERLSGGDIDDERIGASRRRSDIRSFLHSAIVTPYMAPGLDGEIGNDDDIFTPTGESVTEVLDRVLPVGETINGITVMGDSSRVPLYLTTPGWFTLNLMSGMRLSEQWKANFGLLNILDRNYRIHGSGADALGIGLRAGLKYSF
ncbi:MAG: TonB-dependent receptor [Acidobacteria bacterium]|nr:TonB-dependent receptor [Acidobacteriota bacterium]